MDDLKFLKKGYKDQLKELEREYFLDGTVYRQRISDSHLAEIHCSKWRCLPPLLGMKTSDVRDIDCGPGDEEEKIHNFFMIWRSKGSASTYEQLIKALLGIHYGYEDARRVCELIKLDKKGEFKILQVQSTPFQFTGII